MNLIKEIEELSCDFCIPLEPQGVMEALVTRLVSRYAMAAAGIWRLNAGQSRPFACGLRRQSGVPRLFARDLRKPFPAGKGRASQAAAGLSGIGGGRETNWRIGRSKTSSAF